MKAFFRSLNRMSEPAFTLLRGSLQTACTMLFCAFLLLLHMGGPPRCETRELWYSALELYTSPVGILLLGVIFCVLLEERSRR